MQDRNRDTHPGSRDSAMSAAVDASGRGFLARPGGFRQWFARFDAGRFMAAELLLLVTTVACFSRAQSDTYWHLAAGRVMSRTGRVMLTDEFSHTIFGARWLNYEWLSQVVFYQVYGMGGMPLLTAMCALLALGSFVLAWKLTRGSNQDRVLLLALALPLVAPGWSLRPKAFTLFLLLAVVHVVRRGRFRVLPLLFLLWANLHAGVALGLVVLVADFIAAVTLGRAWRHRAAAGLLSVGATLLTPLGLSLWPEVWRSVNRSSANQITEWMAPGLALEYAFFWMSASVLIWLVAARWRRLGQLEDRTVVLASLLMLLLAVRASRNIVPFGLLLAPAISVLLWGPNANGRPVVMRRTDTGTVLRALVFAASLAAAVLLVHRRWTMTPSPVDWVPVSHSAASAIRGCPGPIYNHYDMGGYIIWFVPEQKVFLDSRQDPYPVQLVQAQRKAGDPAVLRELMARYRIRCAALEPDAPEVRALRTLGWAETYRDRQWVVATAPGVSGR